MVNRWSLRSGMMVGAYNNTILQELVSVMRVAMYTNSTLNHEVRWRWTSVCLSYGVLYQYFFFLMLNSWILRLGMAETYRYVPTVLVEIAGANAGGLQCLFYSVPPNKNILSIKTFQAVVRFL